MRWVSRTALRPFYAREIDSTPCTRSWVGLWVGVDEAKTLALHRNSNPRPPILWRIAVPRTLLRPPVLMLVYEIYIVSKCVCTELYIGGWRSVSTSASYERVWSSPISNFFTITPAVNSVVQGLLSGCDSQDKTVADPGNRPGPPLSRQPY